MCIHCKRNLRKDHLRARCYCCQPCHITGSDWHELISLTLLRGIMENSLSLVVPFPKREGFVEPHAELVGYFSRNEDSDYLRNISQLSFLSEHVNHAPMKLMFDANQKWYKLYRYETLPNFSPYFIEHKNKIREFSKSTIKDVGFISNVRCFLDISTMLFGWEPVSFHATLFQGVIYLDTKRSVFYDDGLEFISRRFANCVTVDTPRAIADPFKPFDEAEDFVGIYETNINRHKIMCGAITGSIFATKGGINAKKIGKHLDEETTIKELKERAFVRLEGYNTNDQLRNYTTRKLWIESCLTTVKDFYIAEFSCPHLIQSSEYYTIDDLISMREGWNPEDYLGFCDKFLDFIKSSFIQEIINRNLIISNDDIRSLPKLQLTFTSRRIISLDLVTHEHLHRNIHLPEPFINQFL